MTPAIILPPDQWSVLDSGWLWLRAERVYEWLDADGMWAQRATNPTWKVSQRGKPLERRERTVPPSIPEGLEPTACEDCGGHGRWPQPEPLHPDKVVEYVCEGACGGSGVVAPSFYIGTEQCRAVGWDAPGAEVWEYRPHCRTPDGFARHETRVALLAEARFTGPPIPVVDKLIEPPCVWLSDRFGPQLWDGTTSELVATAWAQGLRVGDVLVPVAVDMLDTPITDKGCPDCDCGTRVRLSADVLVPGTWGTIA